MIPGRFYAVDNNDDNAFEHFTLIVGIATAERFYSLSGSLALVCMSRRSQI